MIAHALPRAVRSSCSSSAVIGPAVAATTSTPHIRSSHQRRRSSSKTSSSSSPCPPNGQRPSDQAPSNASPSTLERAQRGLSRRKTAVEPELTKPRENRPSRVLAAPSSQHLSSADVSISKFFSIHRPISITSTFPPPTSAEQFNQIFTPRPKSADVIYTISNTINALEGKEEHDLRRAIMDSSSSHNTRNATPSDVKIPSLDEMLKQFRPFNVPPPPVPFEDAEQSTTEAQSSQQVSTRASDNTKISSESRRHRSLRNRTALPNILARYMRHATNRVRQHFADQHIADMRPRAQQLWVLSVRRQRKLKIKKHKYKKRLRATRVQRRREGKL